MKAFLADACLLLGLLAVALLQSGWVFWPRLGEVMALANAVFLFALAVAWLWNRFTRKG